MYSNRLQPALQNVLFGSFTRDRHARRIYRRTFRECVVHGDLGRKDPTTRYNSAASLALRVILSVSLLWNIFGSFTEPFICRPGLCPGLRLGAYSAPYTL